MAKKNASLDRLKLSAFKLNALLEITTAINENLTVPDLLDRYSRILIKDLDIGVMAVFKKDDTWECILSSGTCEGCEERINVEKDLLLFKDITWITSSNRPGLEEFDIVIPVITKDAPNAFVLIGDIDEDAEGVSPIIKHLHFIQTLSNIIIVAIDNIRFFEESLAQEALRRELELASRMQNMLIPSSDSLPRTDDFQITAFYHPHYDVGGDYYDCITLSDKEVGFCIADVSGKGISAAILMSNFQANIQALFTADISLPSLMEKLNERVTSNAKGEKFITLFLAKYNVNKRELEYINAAHNPPLLYDLNSHELNFLSSGCVGLGMLDTIPSINHSKIKIKEGAKLFCYTDGLVELISGDEIEVGTKLIEDHIKNNDPLETNIQEIIKTQNILKGSSSIFDDITILGIEFSPTV